MIQTLCENMEHYVAKENIRVSEPMSKHTTFRVGGPAKAYVTVEKEEELLGLISYLKKLEESFFIVGNGSNLLVSDQGFDGVVIQLGNSFGEIQVMGDEIYAKAGARLSSIARKAMENSLEGMEFASGIPGTLGGALVMNAGAYGGEMKQIVTKVRIMSYDGSIMELTNEEMEFGYRTSVVKRYPYIILDAVLKLKAGDKEVIRSKIEELTKQRFEKQPLEYPSAGSTFKRPEGYFAGKLIMDAGLRGASVGDAQVSEKHCGFIVNKGNATATDIYKLITEVQQKVKTKFDIQLETEVIKLGKF